MVSKNKLAYIRKYNEKHYDQILLRVKKPIKKIIVEEAKRRNQSISKLMTSATLKECEVGEIEDASLFSDETNLIPDESKDSVSPHL